MALQASSSNIFSLDFQIERAGAGAGANHNVPEDHQGIEFAYNNPAGSSRKRMRSDEQLSTPSPQNKNRVQCSAGATYTSGRGATRFIEQHNSEIDALIRLHNEKIRLGIEEIEKRNYGKLISLIGKRFTNILREKDAELEMATKKKAELEARLAQIAAESQIWFDLARNSETVACALKANLDSVIRRGAAGERHVAEDAGSCCDGEILLRRKCRSCRERDVSVLMLPCRHLCLCKECEPGTDTCPMCNAEKNGSVEVFME